MIEAREITKRYLDSNNEVVAVSSANIMIHKGDFILVVGRSGSGKSTLLGILGGLIRPSTGSVLFDGGSIWTLPDDRLSALRAEQFGFIFQFSGLIPTLTSLENVMIPSLFSSNGSMALERATDLLDSFGLSDKVDSYPSQLSGGEIKRVAIARSLINNPSVVYADEPTGDLDVATERVIMEYLQEISREGKTIIMVSHDHELSKYANKVFRMEKGVLSEISQVHAESVSGMEGRAGTGQDSLS